MVGEPLSSEGLAEARDIAGSAGISDLLPLAHAVGVPQAPGGDLLGRVGEMLTQLLERFGQSNQRLQELVAVLHQRFPDKVPEAEMPRSGAMTPGAEEAKPSPEEKDTPAAKAEEKLSDSIEELTDAIDELSSRTGGAAGGTVPFRMPRELVPATMRSAANVTRPGGPVAGGMGLSPTPPGPSTVGDSGPPIDRSYLQKLLDTAPRPSAGTRAAFLKRMDVRRMLGLTVRPRDIEALSGLIDTGSPMQEGLLSRAGDAVGKGRFNQDMVDTLRHLWGVGGAARPADLMQQVFGRLIGAAKGKTAVTADMIRDMALSGVSPSGPFDFSKLYRRFKEGNPPSPKQLREMAGAFGFEGMLPPEWFPKGNRLPGNPTAPGFVGPVQPPVASQPGDPAAPGFVGPPAPPSPRMVKLAADLAERQTKGLTLSQQFLGQVRGALRGRAGSEELFKTLEGMAGKKITPETAAMIAKVGGFNLLGQGGGEGTELHSLLVPITPAMMRDAWKVLRKGGRLAWSGMRGLAGMIGGALNAPSPTGAAIGRVLGTITGAPFYAANMIAPGVAAAIGAPIKRMLANPYSPVGAAARTFFPGAGGAGAGAAAGGMWMVATAAAAAGYALTRLPHDIQRGARGSLESYRELSGVHGGMAATFIAGDIRSLQRDRDYADRILGSTRALAAATNDLEEKLQSSRVLWSNASNLFWSGLSGIGSGLATAFEPTANSLNSLIGGEGPSMGAQGLGNRLARAWGRGAMSVFGQGTYGIPTGPFAGLVGAYDLFFGKDDVLEKLSGDNPWSRYLLEMGQLRPQGRP